MTNSPDDEANVGVEDGHQDGERDQDSVQQANAPQPELVGRPKEVGEELVADEEAKQRVHRQDLEEQEASHHRQDDIVGREVVQEVLWGRRRQ